MKKIHVIATLTMALAGITFSLPALSVIGTRQGNAPELTTVIINASPHVKPYLPVHVKGGHVADGNCNPDGTLNPRNRDGLCYTVRSDDGKSVWLLRTVLPGQYGGKIEKIFKLRNGNIVPWVVFDVTNQNIVTYSSQEAQQFAGTRNDNDSNTAGTPPQNQEKNAAKEILDAIPKDALQRALGILGGKGR